MSINLCCSPFSMKVCDETIRGLSSLMSTLYSNANSKINNNCTTRPSIFVLYMEHHQLLFTNILARQFVPLKIYPSVL